MSVLQILGVSLLVVAVGVATWCCAASMRRRRGGVLARSEAAGLLGQLAADSAQAQGELESVLAGIRSSDGQGLSDWLSRLVRAGRGHGQKLDVVHARLERLAMAERSLVKTAGEVARQRDRVHALCVLAEGADPEAAVASVTAAVKDVLAHEQALRSEVTDARARLAGRAARAVEAERDRLTDPVTRLPNRRALDDRLAAAGRSPEGRFAIAILRAEEIAEIGARLGPAAADAVAAVAARVIRDSVRGDAFVARVGADEFAVLLSDADARTTTSAVTSCRRAADAAAVRLPDETVRFSLRAGVSLRRAGVSPAEVLIDADAALEAARRESLEVVVAGGSTGDAERRELAKAAG